MGWRWVWNPKGKGKGTGTSTGAGRANNPLGAIPTMLLGAMLAPAMPHGVMMAPTMPLGAMLALTMPLGPMMAPTMPLGTAVAVPEMVVGRQTIVVVPDMVLEVVSHSQVQEIGMVGPQTRALVMAVADRHWNYGHTGQHGQWTASHWANDGSHNDGDGPYSRSRPTGIWCPKKAGQAVTG